MGASGQYVNINSLGKFAGTQERNNFYFEEAFENLQQAYDDINKAKICFDSIGDEYLPQSIKPTPDQVQDLIRHIASNKKAYGSMMTTILSNLNLMNLNDVGNLLKQLSTNGKIDQGKVKDYLKEHGSQETLLKALLTMSITGEKETLNLIKALININNPDIAKYMGITVDLASKNPSSLFTALIKGALGENSDDIINQYVSNETASTIASYSVKYLGVFMAIGYASVTEGMSLSEKSQYGNLTSEDWGWAMGSIAFAGASSWAGAALATSGAGGPAIFAGTAGIIGVGLIFKTIKKYATEQYEIGDTGIDGNGLILSDAAIAEFTGEKKSIDNANFVLRDKHGNEITVDKDTAYDIMAKDWRNYFVDEQFYNEGQSDAITKYFKSMGELNNPYNYHYKPTRSMGKVNRSMGKKNPTSADIWETFVTEFSDATDDLTSAVNMDNLLIDMYELGFTQDD